MLKNRHSFVLAFLLVALFILNTFTIFSQSGVALAAPTFPTGLHVSGNSIVNGNGNKILMHGVNRSGTEYACEQGWGMSDGPVDPASMQAIASWQANAVRLPLNEHCWLGLAGLNSSYSGINYQNFIAGEVAAANSAGLAVILDLHLGGPKTATGFVSGVNGQQPMADADYSPLFWSQVATAFKGNTSVIFDLFNEPFNIDWNCWKNGCTATSSASTSYQAAGMQQLVDAVRNTGATNLIMLGGLGWSSNNSSWAAYKPADSLNNLAVSWHQYQFNCTTLSCWQSDFNNVQASYPVIVGEVGTTDCTAAFLNDIMAWLDAQSMSYLAWTWDTWGGCQPLISSYTGTPTAVYGQTYHDHLAALGSVSTQPSPSNLVPVLSSISTNSVRLKTSNVQLKLTGTNFVSGATVIWTEPNGTVVTLTPSALTATSITVIVPSSIYPVVGTYLIKVSNPSPGGGPSNSIKFSVKR